MSLGPVKPSDVATVRQQPGPETEAVPIYDNPKPANFRRALEKNTAQAQQPPGPADEEVESIELRRLVEQFDGAPITVEDAVDWTATNLHVKRIRPQDAPHPTAWNMWKWATSAAPAKKDFWGLFRTVKQKRADTADAERKRDSEKLEELYDLLERELK
jgi:hypothetical protein